MMTLANYGIGSNKQKDPSSAKLLSRSLQTRTRAELLLKQHLKSNFDLQKDKRNEILNKISDYYARIPFFDLIWNKYQTKQCILDSVLLLDSKLNPYKARDAFKHVEQMLINLVHLPWHEEFRRIYTYSGSFRSSISDPLIGVEEVFKAAGFSEAPDNPMHLILPENKMPQIDDGESVTSVIFDCMLAQVVFSDIIDVFERCCKVSKRFLDKEEYATIQEVNCYSWIQAYFRERCQQTTERSSSNIQELLNNITNHLSKLESKSLGNVNLLDRVGGSSNLKSTNNELKESPRSLQSVQERTREFLAQQAIEEQNLLTLSNDLLRLPNEAGMGNKRSEYSSSPSATKQINRSTRIEPDRLTNGYTSNNQYHQQALFNRLSTSRSNVDSSSSDLIDGHNVNAPLNLSIESDINHHQHNDREPLIPKYERSRVVTSQHKRGNLFDDPIDLGGAGHQPAVIGRHHFNEHPYFSETSSHHSSSANYHQNSRGLKYNAPHKYESREQQHNDNKIIGRSYWSCGSCTYSNQANSEICEMCRNRRSSNY